MLVLEIKTTTATVTFRRDSTLSAAIQSLIRCREVRRLHSSISKRQIATGLMEKLRTLTTTLSFPINSANSGQGLRRQDFSNSKDPLHRRPFGASGDGSEFWARWLSRSAARSSMGYSTRFFRSGIYQQRITLSRLCKRLDQYTAGFGRDGRRVYQSRQGQSRTPRCFAAKPR